MFERKGWACSLCRRRAAEVTKLVAAPKVYIRDRCEAAANRIVNEADADPPAPPRARAGSVQRSLGYIPRLSSGDCPRRSVRSPVAPQR